MSTTAPRVILCTPLLRPFLYRDCTMPKPRAKAEVLVAATEQGGRLPADARERILNALTVDLRAASERAAKTEDRVAALETQTRHLQEAVLLLCRLGAASQERA